MDLGELMVRWTVRLSLLFYLGALLLRVTDRRETPLISVAKWLWGLGAVTVLLHTAAAFHFVHQWSQQLAYEHTARETAAAVGLNWGGGIYVNYLFATVWMADSAWWFVRPRSYLARPRWIEFTAQGFLAFVVVNATVIFHAGLIRGAAAAGLIALACAWCGPDLSRFAQYLSRGQ